MGEEKLLTIREVSLALGISEKEVIELAESQAIPAYRIGGVYLRFKRQQIEEFKRKNKNLFFKDKQPHNYSVKNRLSDFFYFNDFYILSGIIILIILVIIFRGY